MSREYTISSEALKTFFHDVNGPITTTRGIGAELSESVRMLSDEIDNLESQIQPESLKKLKMLINEDINPCLQHIETSVARLQGRVSVFAKRFPDE